MGSNIVEGLGGCGRVIDVTTSQDTPGLHIGAVSIDYADPAALAVVGARLAEHQPTPDLWRVFLDPAGHPFCLTTFGA
jgi:hypothetical protein